jgi:small GTP-binding protein
MKKFAVAVIGEAYVGKTTIAGALMHHPFTTDYKPTIGASMVRIPYPDGDGTNWFYIWDTAGMEIYRSLAPIYYRDSLAAVLVYDVSNQESFEKLPDWVKLYRESCGPHRPILVVGNKIDLDRTVTLEKAEEYAKSTKSDYMEVSAKVETNIEKIIPRLHQLIGKSRKPPPVTEPVAEQKAGCCS